MQMAAVMPQLEHAVYHGCEAIEDWLLGTACCVRLLDCAFTPIGDRGLQLLAQVSTPFAELREHFVRCIFICSGL